MSFLRRMGAVLLMLCLLIPMTAAAKPLEDGQPMTLTSPAAILAETATGAVIFEKNADERREVASITKLMTALLVLEALDRGDVKLTDQVQVSQNAAAMKGSQALLDANATYSLEDLLRTTIMASANDSAVALSEYLCGSEEAFVARMNARARELGMEDTCYVNCTGYPQEGQYTTARDASKILRAALQQEHFMTYFGTTTYTMEATNKHEERNFTTTNYMMLDNKAEYDYRVTGGRTGANSSTDRVFAATAEKNGLVYLTVIMGADSDYEEDGYSIKTNGGFHDTKELLDMGFDGYTVTQVLHGGQAIAQYSVMNGENAVVAGVDQSCTTILPQGITAEDLIFRYAATDLQLNAPVEQGQRLTYVQVWYGSVCVGQSSISALNRVAVAQAADDPGDGDEGGGLQFGLTILGVLLAIIGGVVVINFVIKTVRLSMLRSRAKKRRRNRRRSR